MERSNQHSKEEPFGSNYESTEKTLLQQPTEHLTEVHTEKYDHNIVVKSQPNLPLPELRIAYPAIALRSNWGMQHSGNCRKGKISNTNSKIGTGFM